jgi:hypothetical protein
MTKIELRQLIEIDMPEFEKGQCKESVVRSRLQQYKTHFGKDMWYEDYVFRYNKVVEERKLTI